MPLTGGVVATLALTVLGMPAGSVRVPLTGTTLTELPGGALEPAAFGGDGAPSDGRLMDGCVSGWLEGPSPDASPERGVVSELPEVRPDVTGERSVIGGWRRLAAGLWLGGISGDGSVVGWLRGLLRGPFGLADDGGTASPAVALIPANVRADRVSAPGSNNRDAASFASPGADRVSAPAGSERGSKPASEGRASCLLGPTVLGAPAAPGFGAACDAAAPRWLAGPFERLTGPRLCETSPPSGLLTEPRSWTPLIDSDCPASSRLIGASLKNASPSAAGARSASGTARASSAVRTMPLQSASGGSHVSGRSTGTP
jgi:hypothetical protein